MPDFAKAQNAGTQQLNDVLTNDQYRSNLAALHNSTFSVVQFEEGEGVYDLYDNAVEAATNLIIAAGFDGDDSDREGATLDDVVMTLLVTAFLRCPEMAERINSGEIS